MRVKAIDSSQKTLRPLEEKEGVLNAVQNALDAAVKKLGIGVELKFRRDALELIEKRAGGEAGGDNDVYRTRLAKHTAYYFLVGYCQALWGTEAQDRLEKEILAGLVKEGVKLPSVK